jgi:hypothetical protein
VNSHAMRGHLGDVRQTPFSLNRNPLSTPSDQTTIVCESCLKHQDPGFLHCSYTGEPAQDQTDLTDSSVSLFPHQNHL